MKSRASVPSWAHSMRLASFCFFNAWSVNSASEGLSSTRRIVLPLDSLMLSLQEACWPRLGRRGRESEKESGAFARTGLRPDFAAVTVNDPLNGRQAHTGPFEVFLAVEALENSK